MQNTWRKGVAVAGAGGQAEGKLGEQRDEVGVVLGKRAEHRRKTLLRAGSKRGFDLILLQNVVDVIPRVKKGALVQRPERIEHRSGPECDQHGAVKKVQRDARGA